MMKHIQYLFLLLAVGCAAIGVPTPQTFNEQLAAGYTTLTTVIDETRTLLVAKRITPEDAENVIKQTDNIADGFTIARALRTSNPAAAQTKLTATIAVLTALQSYLAAKKGTK